MNPTCSHKTQVSLFVCTREAHSSFKYFFSFFSPLFSVSMSVLSFCGLVCLLGCGREGGVGGPTVSKMTVPKTHY